MKRAAAALGLVLATALLLAGCAGSAGSRPLPRHDASRARSTVRPSPSTARPSLVRTPHVVVSAHRGGAGQWPQNSLLAFRNSLAAGYDEIEADAWLTADGHAVIYHDATISGTRCPSRYDGRPIRDLLLSQVDRIRCQVQPIPTEAQLVDLVADWRGHHTVLRLEAKSYPGQPAAGARTWAWDVAEPVVAEHLAARAVMEDFDWAGIAGFHLADRALRVSALITRPTRAYIASAAQLGAYDLSYDAAYATRTLDRMIAAAGLVPTVWGIDDVPNQPGHPPPGAVAAAVRQARRMAVLGVRVVITNYPAAVRAALGER